jgi:hypothetical protein
MSIRNATLCLAFGIGAVVAPMVASARVFVDVDVAPPAPQEEVIPAPRVGFVWAPGYWDYQGSRHNWVGGHYIAEHPGHHWVADRWDQRGSKWHHEAGHWD